MEISAGMWCVTLGAACDSAHPHTAKLFAFTVVFSAFSSRIKLLKTEDADSVFT